MTAGRKLLLLMSLIIAAWMLSFVGGWLMYACQGFIVGVVVTHEICMKRLDRAIKEREDLEAYRNAVKERVVS